MILVSVHVTSENPTPFDLEMKKLIEAGQLAEAKQLLSCTLGEEDSPWMHLFAMGAATVAPCSSAASASAASASAPTSASASAPSVSPRSPALPASGRLDFLANLVWLEKHYGGYEGQWVALRDGALINHAPDLSTLRHRLTATNEEGCMLVDV